MSGGVVPAPGLLLVASPELGDPNFAETVILLLDADGDGALGVVLNRPSQIPVDSVFESWGEVVDHPEVLFQGGPVGQDAALAVALASGSGGAAGAAGLREVDGALALLDLDTPPELIAGTVERLRIFVGYAGWGPGQLEAEIARGDWYVLPATYDDVFGADSTAHARRVLRRQPGDLAMHATRPADPALN